MHGVALTVGSLHWLLERAQVLGFFGFVGFVGFFRFFRFSGSQVLRLSCARVSGWRFSPFGQPIAVSATPTSAAIEKPAHF
jgi:hypothetical protein